MVRLQFHTLLSIAYLTDDLYVMMLVEITAPRRKPLRDRKMPASPAADDTVANEFAGYETPEQPTGNTTFPESQW